MRGIPDKIYLQAIEDFDDEMFSEIGTTWSSDKVNDDDIEYIRVDESDRALLEEAVKLLEESKCEHETVKEIQGLSEYGVIAGMIKKITDFLARAKERLG